MENNKGKSSKRGGFTKKYVGIVVIVIVTTLSLYWYTTYTSKLRSSKSLPVKWPTVEWTTNTPEAVGFDSVKLAQGLQAIKQKNVKIHSLTIVRNAEVVLDVYFYPYDGSIYHDLASVTKSVTTTLIGIAADQGKIDLDEPMLSFFPERTIANRDARKEKITVRHLVSMTAGMDCDPWNDAQNLDTMRSSEDWVQHALDRSMTSEPGTRWVYDSPGMHILSAIIQKATGMTALEFAKENLFKPLGITDIWWPNDPQGITNGWGDLSLKPRDAAKIGLLFLHQGSWENSQVVSSTWAAQATTKQASTGEYRPEDYGYGWYISREDQPIQFFRADGRGGQRILVIWDMNLVLVTTGGGFELDDVTPYLEAAIVDLQKPLPSNPNGVSQLEATIIECSSGPEALPIAQLPEIAHVISGKVYEFGPDSPVYKSIRLDFNDSSVATFHLKVAYEPCTRVASVGLDGLYRPSRVGRPTFALGTWVNDQTFSIEYNEGPGLNSYQFIMTFKDDIVTCELSGLGKAEGRVVES